MDIFNIEALISQGDVLKNADLNPTQDYVQVGKFIPNNRKKGGSGNAYKSFALPLSELGGGGSIPTLQQVLNNNHDLVDGNNFQGTGAGSGNTGIEVIAIGHNAANGNTGGEINAFGIAAAQNNTGNHVIAIGESAADSNTGNYVSAFSRSAAYGNTGNYVNALGTSAAQGNTGNNVIAIGQNAGIGNALSGMTIFSNASMPSYADFTAASAAITVALGAVAGNTYLYHDQTTNSIGAVRL